MYLPSLPFNLTVHLRASANSANDNEQRRAYDARETAKPDTARAPNVFRTPIKWHSSMCRCFAHNQIENPFQFAIKIAARSLARQKRVIRIALRFPIISHSAVFPLNGRLLWVFVGRAF